MAVVVVPRQSMVTTSHVRYYTRRQELTVIRESARMVLRMDCPMKPWGWYVYAGNKDEIGSTVAVPG
jgi:hypothetical protein